MPQPSKNANSDRKRLINQNPLDIVGSIEKRRICAMFLKRCISWNTALCDIRSDRTRTAPGIISARSLIQGLTRIRRTRLVTPAGAFVHATIMAAAVVAAKAHKLRTGAAWSVSMSVGLTAAWQAAKAARLLVATREQGLIEPKRKDTRRGGLPPLRAAEGEGRAMRFGDPSPQTPMTNLRLYPGGRTFPDPAINLISAPR
ncbi:hypothetical protein [Methylobacterium sp. WL7]|uniref:hypothetical protein n=1 Tax=Methylobacterium sp. WL7 TaxID=2603900 RepID=UPI0011CB58AE|nr:hypothetical protein [Methylobacterium sp. WL7]TXN42531.1 hypothetical protein FV233_22315 [Methylobacterium sp. WL7]